jgi:hypothetical protein
MDSYLTRMHSNDSEELYRKYGIINQGEADEMFDIVGIYGLAKAGRSKDVLESARYSGYFDVGMAGACRGGHKDLVLLMISSGRVTNFNWGLDEAYRGGHEELAFLMIENGARPPNLRMYTFYRSYEQ